MQDHNQDDDSEHLQPSRRRPVRWIVDVTDSFVPLRRAKATTSTPPHPGWLRNPYAESAQVDAILTDIDVILHVSLETPLEGRKGGW